MTLPLVLSDRDLAPVELQAARLDGELFDIAGAFCPIDSVEAPRVRAQAALGGRSHRFIGELGTAAWIWGAHDDAPAVLEFCVDLGARARLSPNPFAVVREVVLDEVDVVDFGAVRVTSPLRTAVDLARFRDPFDPATATAVVALARIGGFDSSDALALMERRPKLPNKRRAARHLTATLGVSRS